MCLIWGPVFQFVGRWPIDNIEVDQLNPQEGIRHFTTSLPILHILYAKVKKKKKIKSWISQCQLCAERRNTEAQPGGQQPHPEDLLTKRSPLRSQRPARKRHRTVSALTAGRHHAWLGPGSIKRTANQPWALGHGLGNLAPRLLQVLAEGLRKQSRN